MLPVAGRLTAWVTQRNAIKDQSNGRHSSRPPQAAARPTLLGSGIECQYVAFQSL